jgi:hypothetical protein
MVKYRNISNISVIFISLYVIFTGMTNKSNLANIVLSTGIALSAVGCASWPTPMKVIATPVAVVRDIVDIPFASTATFFNYLGDATKQDTGRTHSNSGYGWTRSGGSWNPGFGLGASTDITSPFAKLMAGVLGAPDYLACRSFCGSAKGKSPWKKYEEDQTWKEFLFPNMNSLWAEPKPEVKYVPKRRYSYY